MLIDVTRVPDSHIGRSETENVVQIQPCPETTNSKNLCTQACLKPLRETRTSLIRLVRVFS